MTGHNLSLLHSNYQHCKKSVAQYGNDVAKNKSRDNLMNIMTLQYQLEKGSYSSDFSEGEQHIFNGIITCQGEVGLSFL